MRDLAELDVVAGGVRVGVLGPLEVSLDGVDVAIRGPKRRALLARLAMSANQIVDAGELAEDLWSGRPPQGAMATLQSHISHLRKDLASLGGTLETRTPGYRLAIDPLRVDAIRFEDHVARASRSVEAHLVSGDLRRALAMWRGRALVEFESAPWAHDRAAQLEEVRLRALEARITADIALGDAALVVPELEALVAGQPLREGMWLSLMDALREAGRHAEALRAGQRCREALGDLGIEPSPAVADLEATILSHERRRIGERAAPGFEPGARRAPPARDAMPLVGRVSEMVLLEKIVGEEGAGGRRTTLISGEPGVGKSRLASEAAELVRLAGGRVLVGRCDEALDVPLQPFVEALEQFVEGGRGARGSFRRLLGRWPGELARLYPDLAPAGPQHAPTPVGEPEREQFRLFRAIADWVSAMGADRLTLMIVEDVHWASLPTILLLRHIARSAGPGSLLLVTYRDTDPARTHQLAGVVADIQRNPAAVHIRLGGLSETDVDDLLRTWPITREQVVRSRNGDWAARACRLTGGNPLFLEMLLRDLSERGGIDQLPPAESTLASQDLSGAVRGVVRQRMDRLGATTVEVLERAAVLGTEFDAPVLWRMPGSSPSLVADAIDESLAAGFIEPASDDTLRYRFCHALVRDTVYDEVSGVRRALLHRDAGQAMEELPRGDRERALPQLARHFSEAVEFDPQRAVHYARQAGLQALARRAADEAVAYQQRALEMLDRGEQVDPSDRCEILLDLGEAQRRTQGDDQRETFLAAARLAREIGDADRVSRAVKGISRGFISVTGSAADAERVALIEEALAAQGTDPTVRRARLLVSLAGEVRLTGVRNRSIELIADAVRAARGSSDPDVLALALATQWDLIFHPSTLAQRRALAAELTEVADRASSPETRWRASLLSFCCAVESGSGPRAGLDLGRIEWLGAEAGDSGEAWLLPAARATWALIRGQLDETERHAVDALVVGRDRGVQVAAVGVALVYQVRWLQGRLAELREPWDPDLASLPAARAAYALACFHAGYRDEARATVDSLYDDGEPLPTDATWAFGAASLAEVLAELGEGRRAARLERELRSCSSQYLAHSFYFLGPVAHVLGLLRAAQGDLVGADRWLGEAERQLVAFGAPAHLAATRLMRCRNLARTADADNERRTREIGARGVRDARAAGLEALASRFEAAT